MRSIRLSLIIWLLILLILSLGTVFGLVYQTARASLEEKHKTLRQLYQSKHDERCRMEQKKLDDALLYDVRRLASLVEIEVRRKKPNMIVPGLAPLGSLAAATAPHGYLSMPSWIVQGFRCRFSFSTFWMYVRSYATPDVKELVLLSEPGGQVARFYQINTIGENEWRSPSLGDYYLPFDSKIDQRFFNRKQLIAWKYDTINIKPDLQVRRVILKVKRYRIFFPKFSKPKSSKSNRDRDHDHSSGPHPRWGDRKHPDRSSNHHSGSSSSERGNKTEKPEPNHSAKHPAGRSKDSSSRSMGKRPPKRMFRPSPGSEPEWATLFIQGAADISDLKETLASFQKNLHQQLADLKKDSRNSLASLRKKLLLISGGIFLAAVLGICWLVHLGLSPVRRLSTAVSEVSEKNLRLPQDSGKLPQELRPIADEMKFTLEKLQRAFQREKQAAADISHELRTPLAAMLATMDVALRKPRSSEEFQELLEECRTTAQQMSRLVERLLALAKLDSGADHLHKEEVDVNQVANQCANLVRPLAEIRNLTLNLHQENPTRIKTDP